MRLMYTSLEAVPRTGTLKDLREWIRVSDVPELEIAFRNALNSTRKNGLTEQQVLGIADELAALVKQGREAEQAEIKRLGREA
ncbi:hypothetical protein Q8309_001377 [Salmonella enterica]|nr:hypothetical protein [Salmonella enterica]